MSALSRRSLLARLAVVGSVGAAGCASLPAGPTEGITRSRTRALRTPDPPRPYATPTEAHVRSTRSHLEGLVTRTALYGPVPERSLDQDAVFDLRYGLQQPRDCLSETAANPVSVDNHARYESLIPDAGYALGFLRSWHGDTDLPAVNRQLRRVRETVVDTADGFDYRCADPARLLAGVGWAERELFFADVADVGGDVDSPDDPSRAALADRVGFAREHTEKMRREVGAARHAYTAYLADRPADPKPFADALAVNRRTLREQRRSLGVDPDRVRTRAEETDDAALAVARFRAARALVEARESQYRSEEHQRRGRDVLSAIAAGRAVCNYRSYHDVAEGLDSPTVAGGPPASALFAGKHRASRRIRAGVARGDPLLSWLLDEAARLVAAGDGALENDLLDSDAQREAAAYVRYRRASGYAEAAHDVAAVLERR